MNRREFLTVSLIGLGAFLIPSEVQAMTPAKSLKASAGKIFGLAGDGVQWEMRTNLGPQYTILGIYQNQGTFYAKVNFQQHIFFLKSTDGASWYTSNWAAPSTWQYKTAEKRHG